MLKESEHQLRDLWDPSGPTYSVGVPEEKREKGAERLFKERVTQTSPH